MNQPQRTFLRRRCVDCQSLSPGDVQRTGAAAPDGQQGQPSGRTPGGPEGQSTEEIGGAESTEHDQL